MTPCVTAVRRDWIGNGVTKDRSQRRPPTKPDKPAIMRFSDFLDSRGFQFWTEDRLHEVMSLQKDKKPDFRAHHEIYGDVLIEIESFGKPSLALAGLRQNPVMSVHCMDEKRVCTAVQHGANQLKPYREESIPKMVVLDDFRGVGISSAVDCLGLTLSQYFYTHQSNTHLSAVAWLFVNNYVPLFLRIFHNPRATHPLTKEMFQEALDENWHQSPGQFWKRHQ
jgi:hypothetical protein